MQKKHWYNIQISTLNTYVDFFLLFILFLTKGSLSKASKQFVDKAPTGLNNTSISSKTNTSN